MYIPEIPDNELKSQLEELVYIARKVEDEVDAEDWLSLKFRFNSPVSEIEIKEFEGSFGINLPSGYVDFLRFSNGAKLCGNIAIFDDIDRIARMNKLSKSPDFPKDYITIASIIGDGEILCFSKQTGKFIRYFDGREIVFDNFYAVFEWILMFIKESAEEYVELEY